MDAMELPLQYVYNKYMLAIATLSNIIFDIISYLVSYNGIS